MSAGSDLSITFCMMALVFSPFLMGFFFGKDYKNALGLISLCTLMVTIMLSSESHKRHSVGEDKAQQVVTSTS